MYQVNPTKELGRVVAFPSPPSQVEFQFVATNEFKHALIVGSYVVVVKGERLFIAIIDEVLKANRYFSDAEAVKHYENSGSSLNLLFPMDKWEFEIARCRVITVKHDGLLDRPTRPVSPGSVVYLADDDLLHEFLGLDPVNGLFMGHIKNHDVEARLNLTRLIQKHLAILSISGGGKSYTVKVFIEEVLRRSPRQGRPAVIIFDVHGEYTELAKLSSLREFEHARVQVFQSIEVTIPTPRVNTRMFEEIQPAFSQAQIRELGRILYSLRKTRKTSYDLTAVIRAVEADEGMNQLVKDALIGWLYQLHQTNLFGTEEYPNFEELMTPGSLTIVDFSKHISLRSKQVIVSYVLDRLFELRRNNRIPPLIAIIEEAHQFCPEGIGVRSPAKQIIETIAREGRKFMLSLVLVSQRPVNLSTTALSQCNSQFILRILNPYDLDYIGRTSEGITRATLDAITTLGVGECLVTGNAVNYPTFIQVRRRLLKAKSDERTFESVAREFER